MKTTTRPNPAKRPVNLLLNEETVGRARLLTDNLSATVEHLLDEYVGRQEAAQRARRERADAVAEAWNRFHEAQGAFADEYSTL